MSHAEDPEDGDLAAREAARLSALRMEMLELHPFWASLLYHVRILPAPGLPAFAATDCLRRIWFNPAYTSHLGVRQLGFVLAHELGHHLFASFERVRGRDPELWNAATDYAINRIVSAMRRSGRGRAPLYESPAGHYPGLGQVDILLDPRFDRLPAEVIYEHLLGEGVGAPWTVVTLELPDGEGGTLEVSAAIHPHGGVDVHLPDDLDARERGLLRSRIRGALEVARRSHRRGDLPGEVERVVDAGAPSRVPWRRLLHRYASQALQKDEYSRRRPNLRYLAHDMLVPGLVGEGPSEVIVAVDTSGSIDDGFLARAVSELDALSQHVDRVTVLAADARVQGVVSDWLHHRQRRDVLLKGGGGTSHVPVFEWVAEHRPTPDIFVGLTDLRTRLPDDAPSYPVLWITPEDGGDAPWGHIVRIPEESP